MGRTSDIELLLHKAEAGELTKPDQDALLQFLSIDLQENSLMQLGEKCTTSEQIETNSGVDLRGRFFNKHVSISIKDNLEK